MSIDYVGSAARAAFAVRLAEICEDMDIRPHGRQVFLARKLKVSQQAVGKWLKGENLPDLNNLIDLADWAGVNLEWLQTGRGPKMAMARSPESKFVFEVIEELRDDDEEPPPVVQEVIDFIAYKIERSDSEIAKRMLKNYFAGMKKIVENPPPALDVKAAEPSAPEHVPPTKGKPAP